MGDGGFFSKPESWLAIITAGTAIVAIWQTRKQIALSNKHQLFDRRMDKFTIFSDLLSNYENMRDTLLKDKDLEFNTVVYLEDIIDVPCLDDIDSIVNDPLNKKKRAIFFNKCHWLDKIAMEIQIVFSGEESILASRFCSEYRNWLQYVAYIHTQEVYRIRQSRTKDYGDDPYSEMVFLPSEDTMTDSVQRIEALYQRIIDIRAKDKILKQIKLI